MPWPSTRGSSGSAVLVVAVWLWRRGAKRLAAWAVVTMVIGGVLGVVLKLLVERARPAFPEPVAHASGYSFPSGHALNSMLCVGVLILVFLPVLRPAGRVLAYAVGALVVLLTGFDRVALGVHFVSDVLAGWVVALAVPRRHRRRRSRSGAASRAAARPRSTEGVEPEAGPRSRRAGDSPRPDNLPTARRRRRAGRCSPKASPCHEGPHRPHRPPPGSSCCSSPSTTCSCSASVCCSPRSFKGDAWLTSENDINTDLAHHRDNVAERRQNLGSGLGNTAAIIGALIVVADRAGGGHEEAAPVDVPRRGRRRPGAGVPLRAVRREAAAPARPSARQRHPDLELPERPHRRGDRVVRRQRAARGRGTSAGGGLRTLAITVFLAVPLLVAISPALPRRCTTSATSSAATSTAASPLAIAAGLILARGPLARFCQLEDEARTLRRPPCERGPGEARGGRLQPDQGHRPRPRCKKRVEPFMASHGWEPPLWLETTDDDPGIGMCRQAVDEGCDVVFVAGGDGTVMAAATAMARLRRAAGDPADRHRQPAGPQPRPAAQRRGRRACASASTGRDRAIDVGGRGGPQVRRDGRASASTRRSCGTPPRG